MMLLYVVFGLGAHTMTCELCAAWCVAWCILKLCARRDYQAQLSRVPAQAWQCGNPGLTIIAGASRHQTFWFGQERRMLGKHACYYRPRITTTIGIPDLSVIRHQRLHPSPHPRHLQVTHQLHQRDHQRYPRQC